MLKRNSSFLFLLAVILIIPAFVSAQESSSTSSPYSRFGYGIRNGNSFGRSDALGGIGIGTRNPMQINFANPASYTSIDSLTFLMQFGFDGRFTYSETQTSNNFRNNINFNHVNFALPITRNWAASFGLLPYAHKGYSVSSTEGSDYNLSYSLFSGNGTMSKIYLGNAFNIGKHFSLGINAWYMFGNLTDNVYVYYPYDENAYDYLLDNKIVAHGFGISTGLQYQYETSKKNKLIIGVTFDPKQTINSDYTIYEERVLFRNSASSSPVIDTLQYVTSEKEGIQLPMSYGAGFSYSFKKKYTIGADYSFEKWKDVVFLGVKQPYLSNSSRIGAGFEYIPDQFSIRSYWQLVEYRMGGFYENSYLTLNGTQLKSYGLTFGLGFPIILPMSRSRPEINISAEIGRLGSGSNDLIRESYARFTLNLLLHDRWFFKRKFD